MTTAQLRLARTLAESDTDLSHVDMDILYGFGLPDFQPVTVGIETVARCMRWQCQMFNGGWDERQYNEDLPHYQRNVRIATAERPELQRFIVDFVCQRLAA
jgi:hypothetical protein